MRGVSFGDWKGALQKRRETQIAEARARFDDAVAKARQGMEGDIFKAKSDFEAGKTAVESLSAILEGRTIAPAQETVQSVPSSNGSSPKSGDAFTAVKRIVRTFGVKRFSVLDVRDKLEPRFAKDKNLNYTLKKLKSQGLIRKVGVVPMAEWRKRSPGAAGSYWQAYTRAFDDAPAKAEPSPSRKQNQYTKSSPNLGVADKVRSILARWKDQGVQEFTVSDLRTSFAEAVPTGSITSAIKTMEFRGQVKAIRKMTGEEYSKRYNRAQCAIPPTIYAFAPVAEEIALPAPINRIDELVGQLPVSNEGEPITA